MQHIMYTGHFSRYFWFKVTFNNLDYRFCPRITDRANRTTDSTVDSGRNRYIVISLYRYPPSRRLSSSAGGAVRRIVLKGTTAQWRDASAAVAQGLIVTVRRAGEAPTVTSAIPRPHALLKTHLPGLHPVRGSVQQLTPFTATTDPLRPLLRFLDP